MPSTYDETIVLGSDPVFLDMMDHISRIAPLNRPVLVIGERGTGKELIASRMHYLSGRWNHPYQKLNCAALPETLLESELFGYEPGAFTGATKRRIGRFELADKGTLFLDEIGTMSAAAQEKLLRVIEYGEFERVGGTETIKVDVRVLGATNIDLPSAANLGLFRHDLLDRLAFDVINVPPLRVRTGDIEELIMHFGANMAHELEWPAFHGFTDQAMDKMIQYQWPGNVRELRNVVERAISTAWDGEEPIDTISFDPFDSPWRSGLPKSHRANDTTTKQSNPSENTKNISKNPDAPFDLKQALLEEEKKLVSHALDLNKHHQRKTAKFLHLSYDQLRHLLKKHDLL